MKRKSLLIMLLMVLLAPLATFGQEELTLYADGDANSQYIPAYVYYYDDFTRSQFVIPAEDIEDMVGGTISSVKFYVHSNTYSSALPYTTVSTVDVYIMEVDYTTMTGLEPKANGTIVYTGTLDFLADKSDVGSMTISFTTPYTYEGGNLLIGIENTTDAGFKNIYFSGKSATGAAWSGSSSNSLDAVSGSVKNFLPKTTFFYEPAPVGDCETPATLVADDVTDQEATLTWTEGSGTYNVIYKKSSESWDDATIALTNTTLLTTTLTGLDGNTTYQARVQSVCGNELSGWKTVSFTTEDPCAAPTNLQFANITAESATISWTAGYQEREWTVKYKKSSESTWAEENVSGDPMIDLRGLAGLTTYNVQVYNCENYVSGNFTTAASFPYTQDFSGSGIPTGWSQYSGLLSDVMAGTATLASSSYGWTNGTSNAVLDGNNIYANIYGSNCKKWIMAPAIPLENNARLTFDVAYTAYSGNAQTPQTTGTDDKFVVLISTDNMASWTILRQWDNAGSEYVLNDLSPETLHVDISLPDYANQNVIVAFYAESTTANTDNNIHVDNFTLELIPSCEKPTNVAVTYEGGTSVTINWSHESATSFVIVMNEDEEEVHTGKSSFDYVWSGLELATTYEVKVKANCDGAYSEWSNPVSFSTDLCMPENQCEITLVLTDSYGDGWNGSYIQVVDVETEMILEEFANQNLDGETGEETQTLTYGVCDGRTVKFVWVSNSSWDKEASFVITDLNGDVICEHEKDETGPAAGDLATYTVNCTPDPCRTPSDLVAEDVTKNSATIRWTENGESDRWIIAYRAQGEDRDQEEEVRENPFLLESLQPVTTYILKVRPVCESDAEKWTEEITFTTPEACVTPADLTVEAGATTANVSWTSDERNFEVSYREMTDPNNDFEYSTLGAWKAIDADGDGYNWVLGSACGGIYLAAGGSLAGGGHDSSDDLVVSGSYSNVTGELTPDNWLISPRINLGGTINFWACAQDASYPAEHFGVFVSTTDNAVASFTLVEEWDMTAKGTGSKANPGTTRSGNRAQGAWYEYTVDLRDYDGEVGYVAIRHFNCTNEFLLLVDDIVITQPNYEEPHWTVIENVTDYSYEITGLTPETVYELRVRTDCGEDGYSNYAYTIFPTAPLCEVPTNLDVDNVTTNSATVIWTSDAASFDLEVNGEELIEDITENSYELTDLDPGTVYAVKVRAHCGDNGDSEWTANYSFATNCEARELPYSFDFDTGNDMLCWTYNSFNSVNGIGRTCEDNDCTNIVFYFSSYDQVTDEEESYEQYLISPELNTPNGVTVEFNYRTVTTNYGNESFVVGYATEDDLSDLTFGETIEVDNVDEWATFSETYPAGTKYVVVYYLSYYVTYLFLDDFSFTEPEATTTTQTIELTEGWNWFSSYIDLGNPIALLEMLEASLGENGLIIKNEEIATEYDEEWGWFGDLDEVGIENDKMYMIEVSANCTVTLEGPAANPAEYTMYINKGWNWIGYPCATEIEVNAALSAFDAEEGDILKSTTISTEYDPEWGWFGDIENMIPGTGYRYYSVSDETKPLVIQTGTKRALPFKGISKRQSTEKAIKCNIPTKSF